MGSWNDIGFTDPAEQQEYDDLTDRLYRSVCAGILTAANALRPRGGTVAVRVPWPAHRFACSAMGGPPVAQPS